MTAEFIPEDDREPGLAIIDMMDDGADEEAPEEFMRQVRLLECVREVIVQAYGLGYWAMIYRAADSQRREKAAKLARGESTWEV